MKKLPPKFKVEQINEFDLIARIKSLISDSKNANVVIDAGDDSAAVRGSDGKLSLYTVDMLVEDKHFRLDWIDAFTLGKRAIAVNISDIAAMGGTPEYALVSLCIPGSLEVDFIERMFEGMRVLMSGYEGRIIGGNISSGVDKLIIDVTLIGSVEQDRLIARSGARPGDRVFVSGFAGSGVGGLLTLMRYGASFPKEFGKMVNAYLAPLPSVGLARLLAERGLATAMIDVSDGISGDLIHILESSKVSAELYIDRLPVTADFRKFCENNGYDPYSTALHGGDSYELLFTVKEDVSIDEITKIAVEIETPLTEIGRITEDGENRVISDRGNTKIPLESKGWDHFRRNRGKANKDFQD